MPPAETSNQPLNVPEIVELIRAGDPAGMERLYSVFARGVRFYLLRHLGPQDIEDKVHDSFLLVVESIQRGELRDPERLMGYVKTIVRRQMVTYIERTVQNRNQQVDLESGLAIPDPRGGPEAEAIESQEHKLMVDVLGSMPHRDSEILKRYYLEGHTQERICREMGLSLTQFRLLKSRAKVRFGEVGRKKLKTRISAAAVRIVRGWRD